MNLLVLTTMVSEAACVWWLWADALLQREVPEGALGGLSQGEDMGL